MRTTIIVVLILTASFSVLAADKYVPLNVKAGLWEVTMTSTISGLPPIPAATLDKLTPEQRATIEERMKAMPSQAGKPSTYKNCLTQDDLNKGFSLDRNPKSCKYTILSSTKTELAMHMDCTDKDMAMQGQGRFEVIDSGDVKGHFQGSATGNGRTMNSEATYRAKWISPVCGGIK